MKYTIIQPTAQTTHELWKPVVVENRLTWAPDGKENVWYEVSLDPTALENMARKAVDNERQISRAGPVLVRVLKRERLP